MEPTQNGRKFLLLLGGSGNLGCAIVNSFKKKNWLVCIIDHKENKDADFSILLDRHKLPDVKNIQSQIEKYMGMNLFDAIINSAGGFNMSNLKNDNILQESQILMDKNYTSSLLGKYPNIAGHLSTRYLKKNSTLIFCGAAKVFKESSSDILLYQVTKTATHSLALTIKDSPELPEGTCVIVILP